MLVEAIARSALEDAIAKLQDFNACPTYALPHPGVV
ncbi:hypothetical protein Cal7507_0870 [Calothrix sp. PCC 7507]|nr:hypothetical protein Cal7507_0870 [Calothrix sp. PCC 7507]